MCQKASKQVNVLARLSNVLNENNKMLLFNSFVECYFKYWYTLWLFCSNSDTFKIEKVQKRALRYVSIFNTSTSEELLQISHKSPLYIIRVRKIVELTCMISINKCPFYLRSQVTGNVCNKTLRTANNMRIPIFNIW